MKRQQTGKNNSEKNRNKVKRLILPNFSYQEIIEGLTQIIKIQLSRYCANGKSIGNRSMEQMIEQRKRPKQIQPTDFLQKYGLFNEKDYLHNKWYWNNCLPIGKNKQTNKQKK